MDILIFEREINDGLGELVKNRSYCSIQSPVKISDKIIKKDNEILKASKNSLSIEDNPDLYPLDYILMSTVWNENDDVFVPEETFKAKSTSIHKPLNIEHEFERIVGHSIDYELLDSEGKIIEIKEGDTLPDKFHINGKSVMYQIAHTEDQQEKLDKLIASIKSGEYFISVEALFPTFDYMLKSSNGEYKIIERNKTTSFLTKYLRIYNGSGVYGDYRIGRVPRNIIFSGQALVLNPANPESIIFAKKNEFLSFSKIQMVYELKENKNKEVKMENDNKELVASLQKQIQDLTDKNVKLQASISENDFNKLKVELEVKVGEVKTLSDEISKLKSTVVEKDGVISNSQKQTEDAVTQLNVLKEKLSKIEAENVFNVRAGLVKDKLKISDSEKVKDMVVTLASLTDEQFNKYIDLQASLIPQEVKKEIVLETKVEDLKNIEKEKHLSTNSVNVVTNEAEDKLSKDLSTFASSVFKTKASKAKFSQ